MKKMSYISLSVLVILLASKLSSSFTNVSPFIATIIFSVYLDDLIGQLFALFIVTVAAAESAIGLAILVVYYRVRGTIGIEFIQIMKG